MICKIWGIKGKLNGINNSINYILDDEKTEGRIPEPASDDIDYITNSDITAALRYAGNPDKTKNVFVSGYMCSPETAAEEFMLTKKENLARVGRGLDDDTGFQAFHIVQSFPDDLDISDEEVHQCGIELCKKLGKYQAVIASHVHPVTDEDGTIHGKCKHNHIIINSHMNPEFIDPEHPYKMKYHSCKKSYRELRRLNDEIALSHGFPIIDDSQVKAKSQSWYEIQKQQEGESYKELLKKIISSAVTSSSSWSEYKTTIERIGIELIEGKHETYIMPNGMRMREKMLGARFTRDRIEKIVEIPI